MDKTTELYNYGAVGIFCVLLLTAVIALWKRDNSGNRNIIRLQDNRIDQLEREVEKFQDRENQRIRDVHEVMTDLKSAIDAFVDIAKGIREMINMLAEQKKKSGL